MYTIIISLYSKSLEAVLTSRLLRVVFQRFIKYFLRNALSILSDCVICADGEIHSARMLI